ncbi:MAG TPA: TIR domain-containing protein [Caulobacteraceae bacterium]|nr:TIR domain-containing protein [Caulobacteraceae bacterium]
MPDIFLSYNREDQAIARRFADAFAAEGLDVWWDVTLRSGEAYDEVTETALRTAKAVVVLWSPRSVVSRWVRSEATLADRHHTLAPVTIEACERPIMFELTPTADLCHWRGDREDPAWLGLLTGVRGLVGRETPAPAPAAAPQHPPAPARRGGAPSLAVLPFTNRSGLAEDEVFAFGMAEDIIEAISRGVELKVVSSSAIARFRSGGVSDLDGMVHHLGVRYVLEGNVRRTGDVLRVTTQLMEADSGAVLWTERFDRPLAQLASLQEELVLEVAHRLRAQSHRVQIERALKKPGDLTAWESVMRAIAAYRRLSPEALMLGLQEATRAVEIAPDYGLAVALVAEARGLIYYMLSPDNPEEAERIRAQAARAIELEPDNSIVHSTASGALHCAGFLDDALEAGRRAIQLNPENEFGYLACGIACTRLDRTEEAIAYFDKEAVLAPGHPLIWLSMLWRAIAHVRAGRWDVALLVYDDILELAPDNATPQMSRAICCAHLGRMDKARADFALARKLEPATSVAVWELRHGRAYIGSPRRDEFISQFRELWSEAEVAA